jgi:glyoxylase-like metal-dependent hydrolase (beta-lactamase superfamily II)
MEPAAGRASHVFDRMRWSAGRTRRAAEALARDSDPMRKLTALLVLLGANAPAVALAHDPFVLQPGHIDLAIGPDGNTVILDAPEGLVIVDTGRHAGQAEAILQRARAVGKPVAAVINTHWHLDHTTGNRDILAVFPQARLVATGAIARALAGFLADAPARARATAGDATLGDAERVRARRTLAALEDRASLVPREAIESGGPAELGGRRFELRVARAAVTEADLWLLAPDEALVVTGDLVVAPVPFFDTACEQGWRTALTEIAAADWTTLIPGHGNPMTRADFARWRAAFDTWLGCAASDYPAAQCADGWMRDAAGFYTGAEAEGVRMLAEAYVARVLRAPKGDRMAYCSAGQATP